jgi:hypothetical protein
MDNSLKPVQMTMVVVVAIGIVISPLMVSLLVLTF